MQCLELHVVLLSPNNTAPEGSVSRALAGLQALRLELAENSGITDPFTGWMEGMFGK